MNNEQTKNSYYSGNIPLKVIRKQFNQFLENQDKNYSFYKDYVKHEDFLIYKIEQRFKGNNLEIYKKLSSGYVLKQYEKFYYIKLDGLNSDKIVKNFVKITSKLSKVEILCNGQVTRGKLKGYKADHALIKAITEKINNIHKSIKKLEGKK